MKILFITRLFVPHIGGVEKHIYEVSKSLINRGNEITILTEKYDEKLQDSEVIEGIKIIRFSYPHKKYTGIFSIWIWLWKNRDIFLSSDIVHCHDVFIWYIPFKFLFPKKRLTTTIHGHESKNTFSLNSSVQKKMAVNLSDKSIGIGHFLEKYLGVKFDLISYGATKVHSYEKSKTNNRIVYVGRLEENTGIIEFLKWLDRNSQYKVDFCGDGDLRSKCKKYGIVHGFCDPTSYYKKSRICVPGGYLAALEGLSYGCELKLFWNNNFKEDYWKMSPFCKLKRDKLSKWAWAQTWEKLTDEYLNLYNSI